MASHARVPGHVLGLAKTCRVY
ncbi:hypothetical protein F383_13368 [Gossypium arboreum]|uniref:Uncharacterized protein n=1 Tax=Gossypium arboreum TaxID=29729 RepID=A0A0B0NC77_GOSAR|nr:hypothetical protein F383_13368 [Gossypium arboreum]